MEGFDIERFRLPTDRGLLETLNKPRRRKRSSWFIWGPIPGEWIGKAAALGGKSLHVALAIRYATKRHKLGTVPLTADTLRRFHVGRKSARQALQRLEAAGLVHVERHTGRAPRVTILEREA